MFCGKCGAQNADQAVFCKNCGSQLQAGQVSSSVVSDVCVNKKNQKIGVIAVAAIVVAAIIVAIVLFGGRSYKKTVNSFFDATFEADAEKIVDLMPKGVIDYALEEADMDMDDMVDMIQEELEDQIDSLNNYLGDDWSVSHKILSVEDVSAKKLRDIQENYEEEMDTKVSAAKNVEVEMTVKGTDLETSNTMEISVVKVGRSWYLDIATLGSLW